MLNSARTSRLSVMDYSGQEREREQAFDEPISGMKRSRDDRGIEPDGRVSVIRLAVGRKVPHHDVPILGGRQEVSGVSGPAGAMRLTQCYFFKTRKKVDGDALDACHALDMAIEPAHGGTGLKIPDDGEPVVPRGCNVSS